MGTVTDLARRRSPVRVSPLPARRTPQRDRALDLRLIPGSVVAHPAEYPDYDPADPGGRPPCEAILIERDARNADGVRDEAGCHDWLILRCPDDPGLEGTVASFSTTEGAQLLRHSPRALRQAQEMIGLGVFASVGGHPAGGGVA